MDIFEQMMTSRGIHERQVYHKRTQSRQPMT